jgi:2'-hydroxyisoflavone reductase
MRLLILGGTGFLGRAVAYHARMAGHHVSCLARGRTGAAADGIRFLTVDRDRPDALAVLGDETFDAVVDVTQRPSHAGRAVRALAGRTGHWTFVSTVSVYADLATPGGRPEDTELLATAPDDVDDPAGDRREFYGRCKVSCEDHVRRGVGAERALICRPGLIVGPDDPSGRFPYWVDRLSLGGEVLAPGHPDDPVQLLDVRDLAAWLVRAAEWGLAGTFDAVGAPMSRAEFLARTAAGVGTRPTWCWVGQEFLADQGVRPWAGERSLPLWVPLPSHGGLMTRDAGPAQAAGLVTRPLEETAADTLRWLRAADHPIPDGLSVEEEKGLLRVWRESGRKPPGDGTS